MSWRSYIDTAHYVIHYMPTDSSHEMSSDCWCHPSVEILTGEQDKMLLIEHREEE